MSITTIIKTVKHYLIHYKHNRRITSFDITLFLRQFATLICANIPVTQCCDILEKSQEKTALRLLIYSIRRDILAGKTLFDSFRQQNRYFDQLTCQLVQIGEHTGKVDVMLLTLANYQEKNLAFKKQIQQALFYPCIIMITAVIVTFSMFLFVIPRFAELFSDMQATLPLFTQWIFYLSSKLQQYVWLMIAVTCLFIFALLHSRFSTRMKIWLFTFSARLPVIHTCLLKIALARFSRNLALTFASGIPITDALRLTANACGHRELAATITLLRSKISTGLQLHHAMEMSALFPILMIQMVKIGEESGMLEHMLDKIADFFESDIDQLVNRIGQLVEPLIMLVLGVLIGGLVIGMYLPIFKLGNTI